MTMTAPASLLDGLIAFAEEKGVTLPVLSPVGVQLQQIAAQADYDTEQVERLILSDQALATEVLRAANSPLFGGLTKATTVRATLVRLGLGEIVRIVLLTSERGKYQVRDPRLKPLASELWRHAGGCAFAAHWIAQRLGFAEIEEQAFLGGLLHDTGKLYLVRTLDEMKSAGRLPMDPPMSLVEELLATAHADQGRRLLEQWQLPPCYVVVARDHHLETVDRRDALLMTVRLANMACHKLGIGLNNDASIQLAAAEEATQLGADDVTLAELEIALEDWAAKA